MKKIIYITIALAIFLSAAAGKSLACSCVQTPAPLRQQIESAFQYSDAVFSGEVIEIKDSPPEQSIVFVKFKVNQIWKGASIRETTLTTAKDSAMCGVNFEVGQKYLVYASGRKELLSTTNCSRTALLGKRSDAKYLAKLKKRQSKH